MQTLKQIQHKRTHTIKHKSKLTNMKKHTYKHTQTSRITNTKAKKACTNNQMQMHNNRKQRNKIINIYRYPQTLIQNAHAQKKVTYTQHVPKKP